ncbi:MAG: trehalase family glycosidase [bacterium]
MPLTTTQRQEMLRQAKAVLDSNWREGYTVPGAALYPFQWNWDSGFIALGYSHYDLGRAKQEIRSLFKGQWQNGLLPHIVFHVENDNYFPGPEIWQTEITPRAPRKPRTSGIIQPPIIGFILEVMYQKSAVKRDILAFAEELFPQVLRFHRYLYTCRDIHREGLVYIQHNWESGMDNSPTWDTVLAKIDAEDDRSIASSRRDLQQVDRSQRPSDVEYQKYLHLVDLFMQCKYEDKCIAESCPFLVQDPFLNSLLIRSNQALINLAILLGQNASELKDWNETSIRAMNTKLWNARNHSYDALDLTTGERITTSTSPAMIGPLFARVPSESQAHLIVERLRGSFARDGFYLCPTVMPEQNEFEPQRYWRGPVWININWLLFHGLRQYGFERFAKRVADDSLVLVQKYGFHEYFDPRKGAGGGYGASGFSWTAALIIDWLA